MGNCAGRSRVRDRDEGEIYSFVTSETFETSPAFSIGDSLVSLPMPRTVSRHRNRAPQGQRQHSRSYSTSPVSSAWYMNEAASPPNPIRFIATTASTVTLTTYRNDSIISSHEYSLDNGQAGESLRAPAPTPTNPLSPVGVSYLHFASSSRSDDTSLSAGTKNKEEYGEGDGENSVEETQGRSLDLHVNEDEKTCAVCLEDFDGSEGGVVGVEALASQICNGGDSNNKLLRLPCSHLFHSTCIGTWFYKSSKLSCPVCRTTFMVVWAISRRNRTIQDHLIPDE